ncbi:MAG: hypothetical protein JXR25_07345 [Pontiellaceae bacterium]|nr:hypothetical protein [Pontiellaceae bacterium]MBN2784627.1 hypothetical protein [Pontiellaceae bacterium]
MKAARIALILLTLVAVAAASSNSIRPAANTAPEPEVISEPDRSVPAAIPVADEAPPVAPPVVEVPEPSSVQSLEERGDAMLFEIDALGSTPFDQETISPFD